MTSLIRIACLASLAVDVYARSISLNGATLQVSLQIPLQNEVRPEKTNLGPQSSLDGWLESQERIALDKLLANIAPGGKNVPDAALGTVVASPSKTDPDYWYQWVRDAGITTSTLVNLYSKNSTSAFSSSTIVPILDAYADLSARIQHTTNPSGSFDDNLSGLGEPKFMVDGSAFTGSWGRPQRDGPALRALTLMSYLRAYNSTHPALWTMTGQNPYSDLYEAKLPADSVIKADLEYVSRYWGETGFDLWEEVKGMHFFTAMVQLRALREGADIATAFNDHGAAQFYGNQAKHLEDFVREFWSEDKGHIVAMLDSQRSGLDCGNLLGAILGSSDEEPGPYPPYSDEVLVTLLGLVRDQRYRFPINSVPGQPPAKEGNDELAGVGIGRYPEDVYTGNGNAPNGGNPWFLCTASVSEILYRTSAQLSKTQKLEFTDRGIPFWKALLPNHNVKPGKAYNAQSQEFKDAVSRLNSAGDSFLAVIRTHTDAEGSLSEQFDRVTGFMRGAHDLTWSYGAFLQAVEARKLVQQN